MALIFRLHLTSPVARVTNSNIRKMRKALHFLLDKFFLYRTFTFNPELRTVFSIHSHLEPRERYQLFKLGKSKQKILEIGSYVGASAACFGAAKSDGENARIYCIDTWQNDAMTEGKKDTYKEFLTNTRPFSKWIVPVRGFSTEVVDEIRRETAAIDLLFIDGDHSYEGAKADWDAYKSFLKSGAVVVFHDYGWAEGVQRVIEEDAKPAVSSFDSLPNMWWGIIK